MADLVNSYEGVSKLPSWVKYMRGRIEKKKNFLGVITGPPGIGKCQIKGSKVLMADGSWKNIEDIRKGDLVISPQKDGSNKFSKVLETHSFFSEENYDIYQTNRDKIKLYTCSSNHQIPFYYKNKLKEYTSKEIFEKKLNKELLGFSSFPIEKFYNKKNYGIEPYLLGLHLGRETYKEPTSYLLYKLNKKLNEGFEKLITKEDKKFIPKDALTSDYDYRIELLMGLIVSSGIYRDFGYLFKSKSKKFLEDVKYLIYSVGGNTSSIKKSKILSNIFEIKFYINRNLKNKKPYQLDNRISIKSCKSKPSKVYGFTLDSDSHWYITDNWMVTHNSWSGLSICNQVDENFSVKKIVTSTRQLLELINKDEIQAGDAILWDEAGIDISNRNWQSLVNKTLNFLFQTFRHKRFIVIMTVPYMDFIDAGTRKLLHAEFEIQKIDYTTNKAKIKPQIIQYNSRTKKFYYKYLRIRTNRGIGPIRAWSVEKPPEWLIEAYEEIKSNFTSSLNKELQKELENEDEKKKNKNKRKELTEKQEEVLKLVSQYGSVPLASQASGLSERTIFFHMAQAKKKGYTKEEFEEKEEIEDVKLDK